MNNEKYKSLRQAMALLEGIDLVAELQQFLHDQYERVGGECPGGCMADAQDFFIRAVEESEMSQQSYDQLA